MRQSMQKILPIDEHMYHQIPETFATIQESDHSWTEKVWGSLFAKDGSLQIDFGLGKYHNRNIMDGFAGISRGREQMTVRASRQLDRDPHRTGVGPIDYEVVEPLKTVRATLRENSIIPLSFDVTCERILPPFLEAPDQQREPEGFRMCSRVLRFHQALSVEGWVRIDGERIEISDDEWTGFRDRSWGTRMDVGEPATDLRALDRRRLDQNFILQWSPMVFQRPDGTYYEIHHYLQSVDDVPTYFSGFVNTPDGKQTPLYGVRDELRYDPVNRRLLGGRLEFDAGWGERRTIEVETISDTGFNLGTALYFGYKGHRHGNWRGAEHQDGERYADLTLPHVAREVHQFRDCVVRVREGDATGYAIFETIVTGEHPRYGLTRETSFL